MYRHGSKTLLLGWSGRGRPDGSNGSCCRNWQWTLKKGAHINGRSLSRTHIWPGDILSERRSSCQGVEQKQNVNRGGMAFTPKSGISISKGIKIIFSTYLETVLQKAVRWQNRTKVVQLSLYTSCFACVLRVWRHSRSILKVEAVSHGCLDGQWNKDRCCQQCFGL